MELTSKERAYLRSLASQQSANVIIGAGGLSEAVLEQIKKEFNTKELCKVKVLPSCNQSAAELMQEACQNINCQPVCKIGNYFVVYKVCNKKGFKHLLEI